jgi:hypothetical protein
VRECGFKSLSVTIFCVTAAIGAAAFVLKFAGVHLHPADPIAAAAVGIVADALALWPILRNKKTDAVALFQLAMVATVIHLLAEIALCVTMIVTRKTNTFWLLGQYWVSLMVLIWQLRQVILANTRLTKVQQQ